MSIPEHTRALQAKRDVPDEPRALFERVLVLHDDVVHRDRVEDVQYPALCREGRKPTTSHPIAREAQSDGRTPSGPYSLTMPGNVSVR